MRVGGEPSTDDNGVELRAESATQVGNPGGSVEGYGGVYSTEEREGVGAERKAERGKEERREESRVAVAAAGQEEGVGLQEVARGVESVEEGERAVER